MNGRRELLEHFGRMYGELGIALTFTRTNDPHKGDVKQGASGWRKTEPLPHAARGAALMTSRGQHRNPALVARASGLIVVETDTPERLGELEAMKPPTTVTVRSSAAFRRHHWYRPWTEEMPAFASIRLEAAAVTVDVDRLFLVPPATHPSGTTYTFVHPPEATPIATLPERVYDRLVDRARRDESALRENIASDDSFKIPEGARRTMLFKFACMCRRWTASEELIRELALAWNREMCSPALSHAQVMHQVEGAMRKPGGQDLGQAQVQARLRGLVDRATARPGS